jgi:hypothetical protein
MKPRRRRARVEASSGNVFADLNLPGAVELAAKARRVAARSGGPDVNLARAFKRLQLRPGDIYESCTYHPVLCLGVDYKQDEIWGISLIDGSYPQSCSLVHCGVKKLSLRQARDAKFRGPASLEDRARISKARRWWVEGTNLDTLTIRFSGPRIAEPKKVASARRRPVR